MGLGNYKLVFTNINEEGEPYNRTENYDQAIELLFEYPNDTIMISLDDY